MTSESQAKHDIAQAAQDAIRVIENAKAEALKLNNAQSSLDHDLLIRIETKLGTVIDDVKDIKTNTVGRVEQLELLKADKSEIKHINDSIMSLRLWKNWSIGACTIVIAIATFLAIEFYNHLIHS